MEISIPAIRKVSESVGVITTIDYTKGVYTTFIGCYTALCKVAIKAPRYASGYREFSGSITIVNGFDKRHCEVVVRVAYDEYILTIATKNEILEV